jgi:polysaccharide export outer membrane protein
MATGTIMGTAMTKNFKLCVKVFACVGLVGAISGNAQQGTSGTPNSDPLSQTRKTSASLPSTAPNGVTSVPEDFSKVKLSPGVLLGFSVYDAPEMDATLRVTADGKIDVPLVGALQVGGMSVTDVRVKIKDALIAGEFFKNPQVSIDILQVAPSFVTVFGEVQTPGRFQILSPIGLSQALALAGGETTEAGTEIEIRHSAGSDNAVENVHYDKENSQSGKSDITIAPGDVVTVRRAGVVYVLGAVHRPGGFLMLNRGSLDLLEALTLAEGTSLEASTDQIRVLHRQDGRLLEITVKLSSMTTGKTVPPALGDKDIVYVPASKAKSVLVNGAAIVGASVGALLYRVP